MNQVEESDLLEGEDFLKDVTWENVVAKAKLRQVRFKRNGDIVALCPFHTEKTPSCVFRSRTNGPRVYHCYGCGHGGSMAKFACDYLGCDTKDLAFREFFENMPTLPRPGQLKLEL